MTLFEYLSENYGKLKPKSYKIRSVQRILSLAEQYPQLKRMQDWGLYQLRWGELQSLGLPDDYPIEPHMRSYICEELTQEYRRTKHLYNQPETISEVLKAPLLSDS